MNKINTLIAKMLNNVELTENGMPTNSTSENLALDLFYKIGNQKKEKTENIILDFKKSFYFNQEKTMKILMFSRDILEGQGVRKPFTEIMVHLAKKDPRNYSNLFSIENLYLMIEVGYIKDIINIYNNQNSEIINDNIEKFLLELLKNKKYKSLCSKWIPRKGKLFNSLFKKMNKTPKEFRKVLVENSNTIEQKLCKKEYENIDFEKIPSLAFNKYMVSLFENSISFKKFLEDVKYGEKNIKAKSITPDLIVKNSLKNVYTYPTINEKTIEISSLQWNFLTDFIKDSKERFLPICDVSSSMYSDNAIIACLGLGLYLSEKNNSIFKDAFITFHSNPELQYLKGSFEERLRDLIKAEWGGSTNIEKTFSLILDKAVENKISQKEMPTSLIILSDMQFNEASKISQNALDMIKDKYKKAGYKRPKIIFWNLRNSAGVPSLYNEEDVMIVSGFNHSIMKNILEGIKIAKKTKTKITPEELMNLSIEKEKYSLKNINYKYLV